ncbi:hypothetical protein [Roseivirga pacifica]|uniref:hypothetical protein n=1 Tax=Roseivirga pacifica TaxID=1267423 RepID=UPI003BA94618
MNSQKTNSQFSTPWARKPQEQEGDYFFAGSVFMTSGVQSTLESQEILSIIADLRRAVKSENGLDYLQVYSHQDGRKVWIIDTLPKSRLDSDELSQTEKVEHNYFTILLSEEY